MVTGGDHTASPPLLEDPEDLGIEGVTDAVVIGRGGFGSVYRARQPALSRTVAVKMLTDAIQDETARVRFERECFAMGMLGGHPNIIQVYGSGFTTEGRPYIVMDFMAEGSLADRVEKQGPYDWREILPIAVRIAGALETAHRAGVLHRDVKPENILVSKYGEPQLADFGIARLQGAQQTSTGTLTASIAHAAPELIAGQPPSVASDLYALGSTLYVLLTGNAAFIRDTDQSIVPVLSRIGSEPVPDLRPRGVAEPVAQMVERLMAKDPADRYESAEAFGRAAQAIERSLGLDTTSLALIGEKQPDIDFDLSGTTNVPIAASLPSLAPPPVADPGTGETATPPAPPVTPTPPARRSRTGLLIAGVLVLALVAGGGYLLLSQNPAPPEADDPGQEVADGGAVDLNSALMDSSGLEGNNWRFDPDLADRLASDPDDYLCPEHAAPATSVVGSAAAVAYVGEAEPGPEGAPAPRVANVLRTFTPGAAAPFLEDVKRALSCLEGQGLADLSSDRASAGEDGFLIRFTRAQAALALEIVVVYAIQGDVVGQVVHLGYGEDGADDAITDQLIQELDGQLSALPTT